jgi:hypothetical protein
MLRHMAMASYKLNNSSSLFANLIHRLKERYEKRRILMLSFEINKILSYSLRLEE